MSPSSPQRLILGFLRQAEVFGMAPFTYFYSRRYEIPLLLLLIVGPEQLVSLRSQPDRHAASCGSPAFLSEGLIHAE